MGKTDKSEFGGENTVQTIIGKTVKGIIDRPLGSCHPQFPNMVYPINYGYVEGIIAGDGDDGILPTYDKTINRGQMATYLQRMYFLSINKE